jgi:hypothetical protein
VQTTDTTTVDHWHCVRSIWYSALLALHTIEVAA